MYVFSKIQLQSPVENEDIGHIATACETKIASYPLWIFY
jgi:hypothetical protein